MYISGDPAVKQFQLTNEEWDNLSEILVFLKPLYIATICLSKSKFPSLSTTLPIYICLPKKFFFLPHNTKLIEKCLIYYIFYFKEIEKSEARVTPLKIPATEIIDKFKKYVESAVEKMVHKIATILDPRIKAQFFKNQRNWKQNRDSFKYEAKRFNHHAEEITQSSDDDGKDWTNQIFKRRKISNI